MGIMFERKIASAILTICAYATAAALICASPGRADADDLSGAPADALNGDQAREPEYKLGPQDKVRVMVFEWRPSRDEIVPWAALNAEYVVGASGNLALPLVGEVPAGGVTTKGLSELIGQRLRDRMGLAAAPDIAVEVVQFRPFYTVGKVEKPGEYPFRPGLTVLQAVSVSGGMARLADVNMMRLQRDALTTRGELELLDEERNSLTARAARLRSEFKREAEITFPDDLVAKAKTNPNVARLLEQEHMVFNARKTSFDNQMTTLKQLKEYLQKEVESSDGQLAAHRRQTGLMSEELTGVRTLAAKGLATAPRKLALERNLAQLEGDGLRLEGNVVKVRQDISRTEIAMAELETKRSSDVAVDLQATNLALEQAEKRTATNQKLLYESEVIAPQMMASSLNGRQAEPVYKIVRKVGGRVVEMDAEESTSVEPGDTVKVEMAPMANDGTQFEPAATSKFLEPVPVAPKRAALDSFEHLDAQR